MKKLALLGSTGSIGTQTLEVVRANKDIKITALAAGGNIDLLQAQIEEFHPELVCVYDEKKGKELKGRLLGASVRVVSGMEGLIAAACETEADTVLTAVVGMVGIRPTIAAIRAGKDIALANKETLVCAGHIIMKLAGETGVRILPVDSEHSAIFQALQGNAGNKISRILLTASGGPFRGMSREQMRTVRVEDALKHPNWSMGQKITIDSATMVNKGLEILEAGWLFDVPLEKIEVVVQPKSIIHSMVEYEDGAVLAQLGTPDMKLPIQYALYYPERRPLGGGRLDFSAMREIQVETPDEENFTALALARRAGDTGGSMPTVFNAANEWAVAKFLRREIGFLDITGSIERAMNAHRVIPEPSVSEILETEAWVYEYLSKEV